MRLPEIVAPDKFEIITMEQEPSTEHALTYVIPEGSHNPRMIEQLRTMITKMLAEIPEHRPPMNVQQPAGMNNDACRFYQPSLSTYSLHMTQAELDLCTERQTNPVRYTPGIGAVVWGVNTRFPMEGEFTCPVVSQLARIDTFDPEAVSPFSPFESESVPLRIFEATAVLNILLLNRFLKEGDMLSVANKERLLNAINHVCRNLIEANIIRGSRVYDGAPNTMEYTVVLHFYMRLEAIKVHIGTPQSVNILNRMCDLFLNQGK